MTDFCDLLASHDKLAGGHERALEMTVGREVDRRFTTRAMMLKQYADSNSVRCLDTIHHRTIRNRKHGFTIIAPEVDPRMCLIPEAALNTHE